MINYLKKRKEKKRKTGINYRQKKVSDRPNRKNLSEENTQGW